MIDLSTIECRRIKLNLTKTEVAKRLNVSLSHYSQFEKGEKGVSIEILGSLLVVLDLNIEDVWMDSRDNPPPKTASIIVERENGQNKERYVLPPTPETYQFLEAFRQFDMKVSPSIADPRLNQVIGRWEELDDKTKNMIAEAAQEKNDH